MYATRRSAPFIFILIPPKAGAVWVRSVRCTRLIGAGNPDWHFTILVFGSTVVLRCNISHTFNRPRYWVPMEPGADWLRAANRLSRLACLNDAEAYRMVEVPGKNPRHKVF